MTQFKEFKEKTGQEPLLLAAFTSISHHHVLYAARSRIPGAGTGLFTENDIVASKRPFLYYTGEVLNEAQVRTKYGLRANQNINDADCEYLAELDGVYMDASHPQLSGLARLINHQASGLANCKLTKYGGIIAIRNIPAYTELTYTYSGRWQRFFSAKTATSDAAPSSSGQLRKSSNERRK
jgi:hypothetical protein